MDLLIDGPEDAAFIIVFAHGAGVGMDAPFMTAIAQGLAEKGFRVARFEFPYMAKTREDGTRRPPDRVPDLAQAFGVAVSAAGAEPHRLILAGKSMGGRLATILAGTAGAQAAIAFGYPFHPPDKPENLRTQHLEGIETPTLICQGTRDRFGTREEVEGYKLSPAVEFCWLEDGDHSFKPRESSGRTELLNWTEAVNAAASFLEKLAKRVR